MKLQKQLRKSNKDLSLLRQIKENARTQIIELSKQFPLGIHLYEGRKSFDSFDDWKDENGATDFELVTKNGTDNCYLVGLINGLVSYYNEDTSMFCECTLDRIVWDNYPYILNALLTKVREMQIKEAKKEKQQKVYQIALNIKSMLVDMAIDDKLPLDLNDLDASKIAKLIKL